MINAVETIKPNQILIKETNVPIWLCECASMQKKKHTTHERYTGRIENTEKKLKHCPDGTHNLYPIDPIEALTHNFSQSFFFFIGGCNYRKTLSLLPSVFACSNFSAGFDFEIQLVCMYTSNVIVDRIWILNSERKRL